MARPAKRNDGLLAVLARDVSHQFPERRRPFTPPRPPVRALSNFSLSVERGQLVAVTGANGAGKTTLLDIFATLLIPTSGDVSVFGFDVRTHALNVREHIAYCPAGGSSFWPRLTGFENLQFSVGMAGRPDVTREYVGSVADEVGLTADVINREVRTYSDGQAQRLNLARALLRGADLWLIDEPTRSLDPGGQAAMWALIRNRARERGATVIAATHDLGGVADVADLTVAL
jgi:ABC-2 type transport system ATP-binding protein